MSTTPEETTPTKLSSPQSQSLVSTPLRRKRRSSLKKEKDTETTQPTLKTPRLDEQEKGLETNEGARKEKKRTNKKQQKDKAKGGKRSKTKPYAQFDNSNFIMKRVVQMREEQRTQNGNKNNKNLARIAKLNLLSVPERAFPEIRDPIQIKKELFITGKFYQIHCPEGSPLTYVDYLGSLEDLKKYNKKKRTPLCAKKIPYQLSMKSQF